jgi:hypothetical protein
MDGAATRDGRQVGVVAAARVSGRRQSPVHVLSLDLDWFNAIETTELRPYVAYFFDRLRALCSLPRNVAILVEHHYLYPWCVQLMRRARATQVDVVNIDAHHDFYRLAEIEDFDAHKVGCGNFFAFMAHEGVLHRYTWVTNRSRLFTTVVLRPELLDAIDAARSPRVKRFRRGVAVRRMQDVWAAVAGRTFHGFAIVTSPGHTRTRLVQKCVQDVLRRHASLHGMTIRRNASSAEFRHSARRGIDLRGLFGRTP